VPIVWSASNRTSDVALPGLPPDEHPPPAETRSVEFAHHCLPPLVSLRTTDQFVAVLVYSAFRSRLRARVAPFPHCSTSPDPPPSAERPGGSEDREDRKGGHHHYKDCPGGLADFLSRACPASLHLLPPLTRHCRFRQQSLNTMRSKDSSATAMPARFPRTTSAPHLCFPG
jgi:hypothetical protein